MFIVYLFCCLTTVLFYLRNIYLYKYVYVYKYYSVKHVSFVILTKNE